MASLSIEEGFEGMLRMFNPEIVTGWNIIIQYSIKKGGDWYFEITDGTCFLNKGEHKKPNLIIKTNLKTWMSIINNETTGERAYIFGKLKAKGDMDILLQHDEIFDRSRMDMSQEKEEKSE